MTGSPLDCPGYPVIQVIHCRFVLILLTVEYISGSVGCVAFILSARQCYKDGHWQVELGLVLLFSSLRCILLPQIGIAIIQIEGIFLQFTGISGHLQNDRLNIFYCLKLHKCIPGWFHLCQNTISQNESAEISFLF